MRPEERRPVSSAQPGLRHPGRWLWLLLLIPVVIGVTRLRFNVEVFDLLPPDLKEVQGLKLYQEHFANARELIITIKAPEAETAESAARALAERLRQHPELVARVTWEPPWLEHPDQAAELIGYLWFNQPPAQFRQLAERLAPDQLSDTLQTARQDLATSMSPEEIARLSYDPFGLTRLPESAAGAAPSFAQGQESFSSPDGTFRILFVQAKSELRTYRDCEQWLDSIRNITGQLLESQKEFRDVAFGYTGRPAFVAEVASGMEHDMTISVAGTAVIIAFLFWLAHRRIKPMLWLLTLLALILGSTLALGGLIFQSINVVSMGFAAILLGLAVDYAVVHYQEALAHPDLTIPQIRHAIAPSIFWAATTTIAAFLVLNFGGLPGLGQLGTLVGLGVGLAALIMIFEFLPPLFPGRNRPQSLAADVGQKVTSQSQSSQAPANDKTSLPTLPRGEATPPSRLREVLVFSGSAALVAFTLLVLAFGLPRIDPTANALRPRGSPAYAAVDAIQANLNQKREPLWLLISGNTVSEVAERLDRVQAVLERAVSNQLIADYMLSTPLWPRPAFQ
ncbi:MAG TPA: MMPL family transporter, partial [Clostridia bacterium]|nr:MMPL family transporter [Clostridia bacterium]